MEISENRNVRKNLWSRNFVCENWCPYGKCCQNHSTVHYNLVSTFSPQCMNIIQSCGYHAISGGRNVDKSGGWILQEILVCLLQLGEVDWEQDGIPSLSFSPCHPDRHNFGGNVYLGWEYSVAGIQLYGNSSLYNFLVRRMKFVRTLNLGLVRPFVRTYGNTSNPFMTFFWNLTEIINFYGKNYLTTFPKFWHMMYFLPPNDPILTKNDLILTKFTLLMTFLTNFMSINLAEIIFRNF